MTVYQAARPAATIGLPTREEIQAMLGDVRVLITVIVCGTVLALAAISGVVLLSYTGHGTEAVGALIGGPLLAVLAMMLSRLNSIKHQVNGTTSRLLDAALPNSTTTETSNDG